MFSFAVIISYRYAATLALQATGQPWIPLDKFPDIVQPPTESPQATFVLVFPWKLYAIFPDFPASD
jgi:hypothetical protein